MKRFIYADIKRKQGNGLPRRKTSDSIATVLSLAEGLRKKIIALPAEIREGTKELVLAIVNAKRRGRPPGKRGRPRARRGRSIRRRGRRTGRPRKVRRAAKAAP